MFLSVRPKIKKLVLVEVDYTVHIQEINPWPPSESLKSLDSVILQWQNDSNSGVTKSVFPSFEEGKIKFNESFKLHVNLVRDGVVKGNLTEAFHKNVLMLNLYGPGSKTIKGHLIGSALVDLAHYGIIKEDLEASIPVNFKKGYRKSAVVLIKIEPFDNQVSNPSSKEQSEKDGRESVSELMNEEYAEEAQFASFTDDDIDDDLSRSSQDNSATASEKNFSSPQRGPDEKSHLKSGRSSLSSLTDLCEHEEGDRSPFDSLEKTRSVHSSSSSLSSKSSEEKLGPKANISAVDNSAQQHENFQNFKNRSQEDFSNNAEKGNTLNVDESAFSEKLGSKANISVMDSSVQLSENFQNCKNGSQEDFSSNAEKENTPNDDETALSEINKNAEEITSSNDTHHLLDKQQKNIQLAAGELKIKESRSHLVDANSPYDDVSSLLVSSNDSPASNQQHRRLQSALRKPVISNASTHNLTDGRGSGATRQVKSVRLPPSTSHNMGPMSNNLLTEDAKEIDVSINADDDDGEMYDQVHATTRLISEKVKCSTSNKIRELEIKVEMLQEELIETAATEIGLYSIIAEHGGSAHKVHTPARRLSRLYVHASRKWSHERKASAARSVVSGLILVAKACGNDVARLTFWLSNAVMLRTIITLSLGDSNLPSSSGARDNTNGTKVGADKKSSLKWESNSRETLLPLVGDLADWEDASTITCTLGKIEAWIFSRITESIWWQTLTPHMQSANTSIQSKMNMHSNKKMSSQQLADLSIAHWKKAFKEACERLCPVRAAGHQCGCLPMLARLVMEQCVARLDVAMFNAILRESADDMPTDPVSDPISDSTVLPIPVAKSSFGTGVQLKNAVGSWSRWLSDMFDIDDEFHEDKNGQDDNNQHITRSSKPFRLLHALSNLLMLPKDMLFDNSTRKEACPTFSGPIIKHILSSFVPDEFCPDPISEGVLKALDSEDPMECCEAIRSLPCNAAPAVYCPPSEASTVSAVGDAETRTLLRRSGSSVVRKCHTSDDELDERDSPFTKVIIDQTANKSKVKCPNGVRYQLLREIWSDELMLDI